MSVTDLNSRMTLAIAAIDALDWATAVRHLGVAAMIVAAMPDGGMGIANMRWRGMDFKSLLDWAMRQETEAITDRAGGPSFTKVTYINPTC